MPLDPPDAPLAAPAAQPAAAPQEAPQTAPQVDPYTQELMGNYQRNQGYAKPADSYQTQLNPGSETKFREWLTQNKIPFDPSAKVADYDMRGFWVGLQTKDPQAMTAINPNDNQVHFPDYWKTPYHKSFSADSQWAGKGAPKWNDKDQLVLPNGQVIYDEKAIAREKAKKEKKKS